MLAFVSYIWFLSIVLLEAFPSLTIDMVISSQYAILNMGNNLLLELPDLSFRENVTLLLNIIRYSVCCVWNLGSSAFKFYSEII